MARRSTLNMTSNGSSMPPAPRSRPVTRQSIGDMPTGMMDFQGEMRGGQKRQKTEDTRPLALRTVTAPVFGVSTDPENSGYSADGSSFSISLEKSPLRIPSSATNVYASLLKASIPNLWPNYTASETIQVDLTTVKRVDGFRGSIVHTSGLDGFTVSDFSVASHRLLTSSFVERNGFCIGVALPLQGVSGAFTLGLGVGSDYELRFSGARVGDTYVVSLAADLEAGSFSGATPFFTVADYLLLRTLVVVLEYDAVSGVARLHASHEGFPVSTVSVPSLVPLLSSVVVRVKENTLSGISDYKGCVASVMGDQSQELALDLVGSFPLASGSYGTGFFDSDLVKTLIRVEKESLVPQVVEDSSGNLGVPYLDYVESSSIALMGSAVGSLDLDAASRDVLSWSDTTTGGGAVASVDTGVGASPPVVETTRNYPGVTFVSGTSHPLKTVSSSLDAAAAINTPSDTWSFVVHFSSPSDLADIAYDSGGLESTALKKATELFTLSMPQPDSTTDHFVMVGGYGFLTGETGGPGFRFRGYYIDSSAGTTTWVTGSSGQRGITPEGIKDGTGIVFFYDNRIAGVHRIKIFSLDAEYQVGGDLLGQSAPNFLGSTNMITPGTTLTLGHTGALSAGLGLGASDPQMDFTVHEFTLYTGEDAAWGGGSLVSTAAVQNRINVVQGYKYQTRHIDPHYIAPTLDATSYDSLVVRETTSELYELEFGRTTFSTAQQFLEAVADRVNRVVEAETSIPGFVSMEVVQNFDERDPNTVDYDAVAYLNRELYSEPNVLTEALKGVRYASVATVNERLNESLDTLEMSNANSVDVVASVGSYAAMVSSTEFTLLNLANLQAVKTITGLGAFTSCQQVSAALVDGVEFFLLSCSDAAGVDSYLINARTAIAYVVPGDIVALTRGISPDGSFIGGVVSFSVTYSGGVPTLSPYGFGFNGSYLTDTRIEIVGDLIFIYNRETGALRTTRISDAFELPVPGTFSSFLSGHSNNTEKVTIKRVGDENKVVATIHSNSKFAMIWDIDATTFIEIANLDHSAYGYATSSVAHAGGHLYITTSEGYIFHYDALGNLEWQQRVVPTASGALALRDGASIVIDSPSAGLREELLFVGQFTHYLVAGETSLQLDAPNLLHRQTLEEEAGSQAYLLGVPSKVSVDITQAVECVNRVLFDLDESPGVVLSSDFLVDPVSVRSFHLYDTVYGDPGDKNTEVTSYQIVLPSGSYDIASLEQNLNGFLRIVNPLLTVPVFKLEDYTSQRKIAVGAMVSSDPASGLPVQVRLTYSGAPPVQLASLIGWDVDKDIVVTAPDYRGVAQSVGYLAETSGYTFTAPLSFSYNFNQIRSLYVETNFTQGGLNMAGDTSTILASILVDAAPGEQINFEASVPLKVQAQQNLPGDTLKELTFRLLDEYRNPVAIGAGVPWSVNVLIEWEQDIELSRLRQSRTETKFR